MDSSSKQQQQQQHSCVICFQLYHAKNLPPRVLKCGHTFCGNCLSKERGRKEKYTCSLCRKETITALGISDLPINFQMLPNSSLSSNVVAESNKFICLLAVEGFDTKRRIEVDIDALDSFKEAVFRQAKVSADQFIITINDPDFGEFVELAEFSQISDKANLRVVRMAPELQSVGGGNLPSSAVLSPTDSALMASATAELLPEPLAGAMLQRVCEEHLTKMGYNFKHKNDTMTKLGMLVGKYVRTKGRMHISNDCVNFVTRKLLFVSHDCDDRVSEAVAYLCRHCVLGKWAVDVVDGEIMFRLVFYPGTAGLPFSVFEHNFKCFVASLDTGYAKLRNVILTNRPVKKIMACSNEIELERIFLINKQSGVSSTDLEPTFRYLRGRSKTIVTMFDIRKEICEKFGGLLHGQRVKHLKDDIEMTVIGVFANVEDDENPELYLHPDNGCAGAVAFENIKSNKFEVVGTVDVKECPKLENDEEDDGANVTPVVDGELLLTFGYQTGLGRNYYALYDVRDEICKPLGFCHGDVVSSQNGKYLITIGVRRDHDDGEAKLYFKPLDARGTGLLSGVGDLNKVGEVKKKLTSARKKDCDLPAHPRDLTGEERSAANPAEMLARLAAMAGGGGDNCPVS